MLRRTIAAISVLFLSLLSQTALAGGVDTPGQPVRGSASAPQQKPDTKTQTPFQRILAPELEKRLAALPASKRLQPALQPADASSTGLTVPNFGGYLDAPYYPTRLEPSCVADPYTCGVVAAVSADFNQDGKPDIAVLQDDGTLNVLLNNGNGFAAPVAYSNPNHSSTLIAEAFAVDVNNDGYPDIVAFDSGRNAIIVFLNQKNGTFAYLTSISLTYNYGSFNCIAIGDVNGDGIPDIIAIATSLSFSGGSPSTAVTVQTLLGNGQGSFTALASAPPTITIPGVTQIPQYLGITLGDINGDGKLDLAAVFENQPSPGTGQFVVSTALGNGDGTFAPLGVNNPISVPVTPQAGLPFITFNSAGVQILDVNQDSHPDLLADVNGTLYAALGDGSGNFPSTVQTAGFSAYDAVYADVNGDGIPDIVVDNGWLEVYKGNGDGTFAVPAAGSQYILDNGGDQGLAVADFTGDGNLDVAQLGADYKQLSLFAGNGNGAFVGAPALGTTTDTVSSPIFLSLQAAADITGQGFTDPILVDNSGSAPYLVAALSDGKGNFTDKVALPASALPSTGFFVQPATADFNNDGRQDLLISGVDGTLSVALSNGDGTFQAPVAIPMPSLDCPLDYAATGDLNGDGSPDIVVAYAGDTWCGGSGSTPSGYFVILGNGNGTFQTPAFTPYGTELYSVTIADMNGDGKPDLVLNDLPIYTSGTFAIDLLLGNGDGTFNSGSVVYSDYIVSQVIAGDYNQDGKPDLILLSEGEQSDQDFAKTAGILLLPGNGDGTFGAATQIATGNFFENGSLTDVNNDGIPDLVVALFQTIGQPNTYYGLSTLLGEGGGAFSAPVNVLESLDSGPVFPANFLNDNAADFVVQTAYGPAAYLGRGGTTLSLSASAASITFGQPEALTATLAATMSGRPAPTGTVSFYDGTTLLGSPTLNGGTATLATSALAVGTHSFTAVYSGDSNFNLNTAAAVSVTVTSLTPAFTLAANPGALSLSQGQNGVATLSLSANAAFSGAVALSCSGAPGNATCSVNPASVTLTPGGTVTASLVVGTTTSRSANQLPATPWGKPAGMLSFAAVLWAFSGRRNRKRLLCLVPVLLLAVSGIVLTGCGGNSTPTAKAGSYTITVTATPSGGSGTAQTATVTLTIQ
jgi:Bacterial Ig-like domain (group 3)/FG-GAP-like repeat